MPSTGQRGARSRLADVLADIKNSRGEDDVISSRPTPAKRRSTVNYVALSGHTPRQSRSSTANSLNNSKVNNNSSPNRTKTYVLKFVDNTVDLSQFLQSNKTETKEQPLYPIIRAWAQARRPSLNGHDHDHVQNKKDGHEKLGTSQASNLDGDQQESLNNKEASSQDQTQRDSTHHTINSSNNQNHKRKERGSVDTICSNLLHSAYRH